MHSKAFANVCQVSRATKRSFLSQNQYLPSFHTACHFQHLADTVIILHLNIKLVREGVVGRQCITYMNTALWLGCSIQCGETAVV